jgi:hypothetical protein
MYFESAARPRETAMPPGSNELAEGLVLLRASTLKIIRLQLAIERRDRHVALEAMDDLVAIDRRLQNYLEAIPATGEGLMFRRELDSERAALSEEKLTLAAEIVRRPTNAIEHPGPRKADPMAKVDPIQTAEDVWLGSSDVPFEPEERPRRHLWLVITLILAFAVAAAVYLLSVPDTVQWLLSLVRAL